MLRISTAAPPSLDIKDREDLHSADGHHNHHHHPTTTISTAPGTTSGNAENTTTEVLNEGSGRSSTTNAPGGGGLLGSAASAFTRPTFLRGLSLTGRTGATTTGAVNDVESQAGLGRVGA